MINGEGGGGGAFSVGTNPVKLENENSTPQHGEGLLKTLAADKVANADNSELGRTTLQTIN